jgi:hypothetical protein
MSKFTAELMLPFDARREFVEAWGGQVRRVSFPTFEAEPAMTVTLRAGRTFPVFAIDGRLYASVRQGLPSEGLVTDLNRTVQRWAGAWGGAYEAARLTALETIIVVVNGIACEHIQEPFWKVSVDNGHRGDRPSQIRCTLSLYREPQSGIPPSESPTIAFPADRRADVDVCMTRLRERHPRSTLFRSDQRCDVHRPAVLQADTLTMSVRAVSRALVESAHRAIPILPRAAVEAWMGLRTVEKTGDPVAFARAATAFSALLRLPSAGDDPEAMKWKRRAHVQADLLALRLAAEPDLVRTDEIDLFAEASGPNP